MGIVMLKFTICCDIYFLSQPERVVNSAGQVTSLKVMVGLSAFLNQLNLFQDVSLIFKYICFHVGMLTSIYNQLGEQREEKHSQRQS